MKYQHQRPTIVEIEDEFAAVQAQETENQALDYEQLLQAGDPDFDFLLPTDEWQSICLNYTSGTTGNPKGVVYHHRGAYLSSLGNALTFNMDADSVYLWTLPMFHCNGWTHTWAMAVMGGTHVCLRRVEPEEIFKLLKAHKVTHMCGAPVVLNMLVNANSNQPLYLKHIVNIATGGAPPPSSIISSMEQMGFRITHLYGLTETFGPCSVCVWQTEWDNLDIEARA